jgi:hypothetical protein
LKEGQPDIGSADEWVDRLLRDQDYLLAKELKHRIEELNQLIVQAERQRLRVEVSTSSMEVPDGETVPWLKLRVFKEI